MTASIRGTVTDAEGQPLPNVKILALHEPTGSLFAKITREDGRYHFDNIKVGGPYALTVSGEGLQGTEYKGLQLRTEEAHEQDFVLRTMS